MSALNQIVEPMELYVGPCVLESEMLVLEIADRISRDLDPLRERGEINLFFKGSYDKANRTSINSFRGPGREKGLKILEKVRAQYHLPLLTDFHLPEEAFEVASVVDILQVPAFLCRQTDMIVAGAKAAARFNRILEIKKGQFLSPTDVKNIIEKASSILPKERIIITERGTSFGYNYLIVDMAAFQTIKSFGVKAIYDATHSVQCPGSAGTATGGRRNEIAVLTKAAVAAGADGVFIETHPRPDEALSDAATSWPLAELKNLINQILPIFQVCRNIKKSY